MAEPVRVAAVVEWERLVNFAQQAYEACGVPPDQARDAAEAIVDADGHGTTTHGLKNLRMYVTNLKEGRANPTPNIRQVGGKHASAVLDADCSLGHVAAYQGVRKAIELAKEYGTGTVVVRNSNHYGHSGFWSSVPVRHNMAGFSFTNAGPTMALYGGKQAVVGNNPPSWAVPSKVSDPNTKGPASMYEPVFIDMALSVVAGNRLDIYRRRGEPIPEGWAFDKDGMPTTNPHDVRDGGTLAPMQGYKGAGLAVVLGMMTSFLAGSMFDDQKRDPQTGRPLSGTTGHFFQAIDIGQFTDVEAFCAAVRSNATRIRTSPPKAGVERTYAPGDIENEKAKRHNSEGVPLEQFTLDDLEWVAEFLGVEYNLV
ncbi:MAG: Ldh family oxidoreductase [Chloroflexota bacterium]